MLFDMGCSGSPRLPGKKRANLALRSWHEYFQGDPMMRPEGPLDNRGEKAPHPLTENIHFGEYRGYSHEEGFSEPPVS